jgi:hypothetical protein
MAREEKASSQGTNARHADWSLVKACRNCPQPIVSSFPSSLWHERARVAPRHVGPCRGWKLDQHGQGPNTFSCGIALNLPSHGRPAGPIGDVPGRPSLGLLSASRLGDAAFVVGVHAAKSLGSPTAASCLRLAAWRRRASCGISKSHLHSSHCMCNAGWCFAGANTRLCASMDGTGPPSFCCVTCRQPGAMHREKTCETLPKQPSPRVVDTIVRQQLFPDGQLGCLIAANTAVGDTGVPMDPIENERSRRDARIAHLGISSRVSDPSVWIMLGERGAACAR